MTKQEKNLLDLLRDVNSLEDRCKRIEAPTAVPPEAYRRLSQFRDIIAQWGIKCVIENEKK